jgi:membrane protease YdiL (CAAX protease family)
MLGLGFEGGLALLAWPLGWLVGQPPLEHFQWSARDAALGVAATGPMLLLFFALVRWPVGPVARIERFFEEVLAPLLEGCTLLDLALLALIAGLGEELLFRGVVQGTLDRWLGSWPGLAAASLLFGLMHPFSLTYVLVAAGFGAYLGWLWTTTDNLLVVIVAHGLYDFVALAYLLRRPRPIAPEAAVQEGPAS